MGLVAGRHAVAFVDDHEVPVHLAQAGQDVGAFREIERRDDLVLLEPLIDPELLADVAAFEHQELLVELLFQLALPLEAQVCGTDHQHSLDETAELQLAYEQPGHDGLARAGVVCEEEPDRRELQEVFVDGLKLVRQRVDARDGEAEVGVELVGDPQRVRLQPQPEQSSVSIVGQCRIGDGQVCDVVRCQRDSAESL